MLSYISLASLFLEATGKLYAATASVNLEGRYLFGPGVIKSLVSNLEAVPNFVPYLAPGIYFACLMVLGNL